MSDTSKRAKPRSYGPLQNTPTSFLLYLTATSLLSLSFLAAILLFFVGMFLSWGLIPTLCWTFGLIVFGLLSYVVFRAFGDLLVSMSDLHSLLEEKLNPGASEE